MPQEQEKRWKETGHGGKDLLRARGRGGKKTPALKMRSKGICPQANAKDYSWFAPTHSCTNSFPLMNLPEHSAETSITCHVQRLNENAREWAPSTI